MESGRGLMRALKEARSRSLTTKIEGGVEIDVTPELLLFGLLASAQTTHPLGSDAEVDLADLVSQLEASLPGEPEVVQFPGRNGQQSLYAKRTPELERAVDRAEHEAAEAGRGEIQVVDLLVGILLHGGPPAADLLRQAGVSVDQLRAQAVRRDYPTERITT